MIQRQRNTLVSVILWNYGGVDAVRATLESIVCIDTWPQKELILVDGGSEEARKECYYAGLLYGDAAQVIRVYNQSNMARLCNLGAEAASGEALLFLRAGLVNKAHDALEELLDCADAFPNCAATSATGQTGLPRCRNYVLPEGNLMMNRGTYYAARRFDESFSQIGFEAAFSLTLQEMGGACLQAREGLFESTMVGGLPEPTEKNRLRLDDRFRELRRQN